MRIKKVIIIIFAIMTSILIGMLLLLSQGYSPVKSYSSILYYSLGTSIGRANTINRFVFLLISGASASLAMGSGVSNLGQFGQLLIGAMTSTVIGLYINAPTYILIPLMIATGTVAGALWAGLAGLGKKFFGMNEFIVTLMLNFIADYLVRYLISTPLKDPGTQWPASKVVNENGILPTIGNIDSAAVVILVVYVMFVFFWKKTKMGYEFSIMGQNTIFARTGGCETNKNFMRIMLLSGALAGLLGTMLICGGTQQHRVISGLGESFANDGLMVSIVGGNDLANIFVYAFLFSVLQSGATGMQLDTGVPSEFTTMLLAIMVISVVAFRSYSGIFLDKLTARKKIKVLEAVK